MLMPILDSLSVKALQVQGFRSHTVATVAGNLHVLEAKGRGQLPPILLFHGLGSSAADFYFLLRALRPHCSRLVAFDFPGHGRSEMPAGGMSPERIQQGLLQLADRFVQEPMVVFGNSLGGMAALRYSVARPEQVRALLLASPAGAPMEEGDLRAFLEGLLPQDHAAALDFVDRFLAERSPLRHVLAWGVRQRFGRPAVADFLRRVGPENMVTAEELASLKMPLLVFWGERDRVLPEVQREFYRRNLPPHGRFEEVSGYGHAPFLDRPSAFSRRLVAFSRAA